MDQTLKYKIESLLFVSGEEMSVKKIAELVDASQEDVVGILHALRKDYEERGVRILIKDDSVQMVSAPEYANLIAMLVKSHLDDELTQAALETLACIAYREPITKIEIDELRGVNSIFSLRNLLIRGLIEKTGPRSEGARGEHYKTTLDFLKKLGIESKESLPGYAELSNHS